MKLLYFAPSSAGGLADYACEQVAALVHRGVEVDVLCPPSFGHGRPAAGRRLALLPESGRPHSGSRLARAWRFFTLTLRQFRQLAQTVEKGGHRHVLLDSYAEYFAPLWAPRLRRLAARGVVFGATLHDPVRDTVFGPRWWHDRSVAAGYSFLRHVFVHEPVALDPHDGNAKLRATVVPHGPYRFRTVVPPAAEARRELDLPPDKPVLLAFGHIRDNKNLHLAIGALKSFPALHLLVAGQELSAGQRPAAYYRELARQSGVDTRCRWFVRFIPEKETGLFFAAADFLSLTYDSGFRSASGVLNAGVQFRKPCIASSGPGPLRTAVGRYGLGVWVEPDDRAALVAGLRVLLAGGLKPRWDAYATENSWERNAEIVATTLFSSSP